MNAPDYHPNLDGPSEPYGLSINGDGNPLSSAPCDDTTENAPRWVKNPPETYRPPGAPSNGRF